VAEAIDELAVGGLQRQLGIDAGAARHVRDGEQEIADLLPDGGPPPGAQGAAQLGGLLVDLPHHPVEIRPVESDARRLRGDAQGLEERRQLLRDAVEHGAAGAAASFLVLDLLPLGQDLVRGRQGAVAEHVRMPADDLVADLPHDVLEVEFPALLGDARLEHDLEQEVTELLAVGRGNARRHRLQRLVSLLEKKRRKGFVSLLAVPRAPVRAAQAIHDPLQAIHFRHGGLQPRAAHVSPPCAAPQRLVFRRMGVLFSAPHGGGRAARADDDGQEGREEAGGHPGHRSPDVHAGRAAPRSGSAAR